MLKMSKVTCAIIIGKVDKVQLKQLQGFRTMQDMPIKVPKLK